MIYFNFNWPYFEKTVLLINNVVEIRESNDPFFYLSK